MRFCIFATLARDVTEIGIEDTANSVRNVIIAGGAPQDHGQEPLCSARNHLASIQNAIQMLVPPTDTITSHARDIKSLADDASSSGILPIAELYSLHEGIKKLDAYHNRVVPVPAYTISMCMPLKVSHCDTLDLTSTQF